MLSSALPEIFTSVLSVQLYEAHLYPPLITAPPPPGSGVWATRETSYHIEQLKQLEASGQAADKIEEGGWAPPRVQHYSSFYTLVIS